MTIKSDKNAPTKITVTDGAPQDRPQLPHTKRDAIVEPHDAPDDQPRSCPKCQGTLAMESDAYGPYVHCLMCGLFIDLSKLALERRNQHNQVTINENDDDPGDDLIILDDLIHHQNGGHTSQDAPHTQKPPKTRGQGGARAKYA